MAQYFCRGFLSLGRNHLLGITLCSEHHRHGYCWLTSPLNRHILPVYMWERLYLSSLRIDLTRFNGDLLLDSPVHNGALDPLRRARVPSRDSLGRLSQRPQSARIQDVRTSDDAPEA
jgi:hypothetical protein